MPHSRPRRAMTWQTPLAVIGPRLRLGLRGAEREVPVEGASGVVADLDGPGLAALAVDGDLPVPQVEVAAPRVVGVIADARQADARPSGRPAGGSRAACLAC